MKRSTPMRRARVKARRAPRRRTAPQEDAAWWETANHQLWARSQGRCEKCGHPIGQSAERHHRQRRRDGGDRLANLLLLHPSCHQWVTEHPTEAVQAGWVVPAHHPDPAAVPVLIGGAWWLLDDHGGKEPAA